MAIDDMKIAFVGMGEAASAFFEGCGTNLGVTYETTLAKTICDADLAFSTGTAD